MRSYRVIPSRPAGKKGPRLSDQRNARGAEGFDARSPGPSAGGSGVRPVTGSKGRQAHQKRSSKSKPTDFGALLASALGVSLPYPWEVDHLCEGGAEADLDGAAQRDGVHDPRQQDEPSAGQARKRSGPIPSADLDDVDLQSLICDVTHDTVPIPDARRRTYWPWPEMSVGSSFMLRSKSDALLKRAMSSMSRYRKNNAPSSKFIYRRVRGGYRFWRVR